MKMPSRAVRKRMMLTALAALCALMYACSPGRPTAAQFIRRFNRAEPLRELRLDTDPDAAHLFLQDDLYCRVVPVVGRDDLFVRLYGPRPRGRVWYVQLEEITPTREERGLLRELTVRFCHTGYPLMDDFSLEVMSAQAATLSWPDTDSIGRNSLRVAPMHCGAVQEIVYKGQNAFSRSVVFELKHPWDRNRHFAYFYPDFSAMQVKEQFVA